MKKLKVEMRRSKIHGNGVFAIAPIRKGEKFMEYTGKLISHEESDRLYAGELETGHTFLFILNKEWVIDANQDANDAKWVNTSCEPNAIAFVHDHKGKDRTKDRVLIEALRAIKPGEEITYDYGIELDAPPTKAELAAWTCRCGSPKCKGTMLKWKKPRTRTAARKRAKPAKRTTTARRKSGSTARR